MYSRPLFLSLFLAFALSAQAAETKPNIIYIMADDLGYADLGCYGQEVIQTPNIDKLASEGLRFTQVYAGSSVCAPSRGVLMTGLHVGHAPVRDNVPHYETYLEDEHVTIAEVLQDAGYTCGGIGKWSLGDAGTAGRATNQGFDMFLGYLNQDHAHYYYPEYLDDGEGRMELTGNTESREHYTHHLFTERTLEFIEENKDGPFFFYGAFTLPHFSAKSEDPTMLAIPSDAPYSDEPWSQKAKNYAAMVTMLDKDIGKIVDLVDELGLTENTLIIVTSDNGPWGPVAEPFDSAGPLRGAKRDMYEGGLRVPFIARWPGQIPAGEVSEEILTFQDMLPTFAELSGGEAPDNIDGLSVVEALKGGKLSKTHEYLYWDYGHCRPKYNQAVRWKNWKGVRLGDGAIELYNLDGDLAESQDVASQYPDVIAQIEHFMEIGPTPSERYPIGEIYKGGSKWVAPGPPPPAAN